MLDYEAFRAEQAAAREAGRYLGVGFSNYVEPTTPVFGIFGTEAATIRIEPTRQGQRLRRRRLVRQQPRDDGRPAHGRRARRRHRRREHRSRATPRSPASAAGTGGSRSGAMLAGAIGETAGVLRERIVAIAAHRLEAAVEDIELGAGLGAASAGRRRRGSRSPRSPRSPTSRRRRCRPACRPGSRRPAGSRRRPATNWANATHVCTCEVDVATGEVAAAALHRQRGLRRR